MMGNMQVVYHLWLLEQLLSNNPGQIQESPKDSTSAKIQKKDLDKLPQENQTPIS